MSNNNKDDYQDFFKAYIESHIHLINVTEVKIGVMNRDFQYIVTHMNNYCYSNLSISDHSSTKNEHFSVNDYRRIQRKSSLGV